MEKLVKILKNKNKTISVMESCTGGMFASEITNIEGASDVFKLGLVTYSNEFKEFDSYILLKFFKLFII